MEGSESAPRLELPVAAGSVRRLDAGLYARLVAALNRVAATAWFAYGSILALQAKLIWGIWLYRDFPNGDTAYYFQGASQWADGLHITSVYAPLYQVYYGSLRWLLPDPYAVTIAHRVILVLGTAALVLAVLRRLLPAGLAWLLTAWWVSMPIHYDSLYEVHLFAFALTLIAVLAALAKPGLVGRSMVLGLLLATTVLVRFETGVAAATWALAWAAYEVWRHRRGKDPPPARRVAAAFAVPVAAVGVAVSLGVILWSSHSSVGARIGDSQSFVLCRQFARGYQERHPSEDGGPLTSCKNLMQEEFGSRTPSYLQATLANPGAMAEHFLWNARLAPYGLQLLLFDRISGSADDNPDFIPVVTNSGLALAVSILVLAILIAGLMLLWRERRRWWEVWLRKTVWGWIALGSLGLSAVLVMLMQRPRPSYLFNLGVLILAVLGVCLRVLGSRWTGIVRWRALLPAVAIAFLFLVPFRYGPRYDNPQAGLGRPLKQIVDRLYPVRDELQGSGVHLLAPQFADEACAYIGGSSPCAGTGLLQKVASKTGATSIQDVVRERRINAIYVDESVFGVPGMSAYLDMLESGGWHRVAPAPSSRERWVLLRSTLPLPPVARGTRPGL